MKTIDLIKHDLLQGQRICARHYDTNQFHGAIIELASQLFIVTGWQTCAENVLEGLRLRERTYRLVPSAVDLKQVVGLAASTAKPTLNFSSLNKKNSTK